ncbi:MAG: 50S ribosomal protein L4 [Candidatus Pacebacteria bacterium]|nr:50S ribosomal protein L4 [Candidatus Paceibacterota bacterium]
MKLTKITATSKSSLTVNDSIFAAEVNEVLLSQAVRIYLSNKRQGTSKVKTRAEVKRTKKKWFKQKGTGNARHGARSAHIFVGGGVAHGPKGNENWKLKLTNVMRKKALISALSAQANEIIVSDELMSLSGKTKDAVSLMTKLAPETSKILIIINESKEEVLRGLRNIESILIVSASRVNALEIAMADKIIVTSDAIKTIEDRLEAKKETKRTKRVVKEEVKKESKTAEVKEAKVVKKVAKAKAAK